MNEDLLHDWIRSAFESLEMQHLLWIDLHMVRRVKEKTFNQ